MTYQQWKEYNNPKKVVLIIEYFQFNFQKLIKFNVSQTDFVPILVKLYYIVLLDMKLCEIKHA